MAEKRLIDADKRIAEIKNQYCTDCNNYGGVRCRACWVDDAICLIDEYETVDAVEVVRCKYCKHYHAVIIDEKTGEIGDWGICDQPWRNEGYDVNETDYCSSAEPK